MIVANSRFVSSTSPTLRLASIAVAPSFSVKESVPSAPESVGISFTAVTVILKVPVTAAALFSPPSARLKAKLSLLVSLPSCT